MDVIEVVEREISSLTDRINESSKKFELYVERAKLYYRLERFDRALNDFILASELNPDSVEVKEYITMLQQIFKYRYTDIYNP